MAQSLPCSRTFEKASRKAKLDKVDTPEKREARVQLMIQRQSEGLDIFSGEPLSQDVLGNTTLCDDDCFDSTTDKA